MPLTLEKLSEAQKKRLIKKSTHCDLCGHAYRGKSKIYSPTYGVICRSCWAEKLGDFLEEQGGAAFLD